MSTKIKKVKSKSFQPSIAQILTQTLCRSYEPANSSDEETELKTTLEIMEEMGSIADVKKKEIVAALLKAGFKTIYNDAGFYWIMKKK
jgi:phage major head subunit gpT-like protein